MDATEQRAKVGAERIDIVPKTPETWAVSVPTPADELLRDLRTHFERRTGLKTTEEGQAWLAKLAVLVHDVDPTRDGELRRLTRSMSLSLSSPTSSAFWRQVEQLTHDTIAALEHRSARPVTQRQQVQLAAEAQAVLDLVADLLFVEGIRLPKGLEVRRRMAGSDRERKRQLLESLVPQHLAFHGSAREDSYSLTPLGALTCKHAPHALALASQLHQFSRAVFASGKDRFTWEELQESVHRDGTELKDSDVELASYVLFCLGVWGRSGDTWSLPRAERLEDLLEDQRDASWLFLRVHEDLLWQQGAMLAIDQRRRVLVDGEVGTSNNNPSAQYTHMSEPLPDPKSVFVIHGRNTKAREEMGSFLRACGLKPINFGDLRAELGGTPTIDRIVEEGMARAQGVVALFTADEYASLRPSFRAPSDHGTQVERWQARPNVIFEAGMAFGRDRDRVVFVLLGNPQLFTDVAGVHVLRPTNDVHGDRTVFRDTLRKGMRCGVEDSSDWMKAGDFEGCIQFPGDPVPHDSFAQQGATAFVVPLDLPDEDARICLVGWLNILPVATSGKTLRFSAIAAEVSIPALQAKKLLSQVVRSSTDGWTVGHEGETVIILICKEPEPAPAKGFAGFVT